MADSRMHAVILAVMSMLAAVCSVAQECRLSESEPLPATARLANRLRFADCLTANGQGVQALNALYGAAELAVAETEVIAVHGRIGRLFAALGDYDSAIASLRLALDNAEALGNEPAAASLLNDLGTTYMDAGRPLPGLAALSDSARLADAALAITVGINLTRALWELGASQELERRLARLRQAAEDLDETPADVATLLSLAELHREIAARQTTANASLRSAAFELAEQAFRSAAALSDERLMSFAAGTLGRIYADAGMHDQALAHARRAALLAQQAGADDSLYRWEWESGRLLQSAGRNAEAILAYRAAVAAFERVASAQIASQRRFERDVAPLYSEYADALLGSATRATDATGSAALLEVQNTLERFRVAEIRNYFENQCVLPESAPQTAASGDAAVIYPVLLKDRTEILLDTGGRLVQVTVDVGLDRLTREVRQLREAIETDDPQRDWRASAQTLYSWLIAPLETHLAEFDPATLVMVPDGPLRTIPLAVLHDGEHFLIERYALSTTPGLSLVASGEVVTANSRVLANGIVEPVGDYPGLPFVATELDGIQQFMPSTVFTDAEFSTTNLESEMLVGNYSIVHMATHAQFESNYRNSFLLAYDDVITMDELEDFIGIRRNSDRPIDLLVLSACQTAAGDDRAALGLAGVAVKAGARSALASLWLINDESTSKLMNEFYRRLAAGNGTKADALRGAQLLLLNDTRYAHPSHWAPFLLIGDWH